MAKKPATSDEQQDLDFEKSLEELEAIVENMEKGDLTLEQSLRDFERGVLLTRACRKALEQAEQKVSVLMSEAGEDALQDFGNDDPAGN